MSKKGSNPPPITCSVGGFFNGAACGYVMVGGKYCALPEGNKCVYQQKLVKPAPPPAPPKPVDVPKPVAVKKKVLEKHVEAYLYKKMKKLGGECYKWSSANTRGVADRICVFPGGIVAMVELKKDTKAKLSPTQVKFHNKMSALNVPHVVVLHGKEEVTQWIKSMGYADV